MTNTKNVLLRAVSAVFTAAALFIGITAVYYGRTLPDSYTADGIHEISLQTNLPVSLKVKRGTAIPAAAFDLQAGETKFKADLSLFGLLPIKEVDVTYAEERDEVTVGGEPFGIKILTQGAIVTELQPQADGSPSPAADAGLLPGDVIISINGMEITCNNDVRTAVQPLEIPEEMPEESETVPEITEETDLPEVTEESDVPEITEETDVPEEAEAESEIKLIEIIYTRNGEQHTAEVTPQKSDDGVYKIGVWVRDSTAGIGTITFADGGRFGGLGHPVCDVDTGQIMPISKGEAVAVAISHVIKGSGGAPGELAGTFLSDTPIGTLTENTETGLYGELSDNFMLSGETMPVAFKQEVQVGKAKMYTTISGSTPKAYDIIIEKIDYNAETQTKNMVIHVTDGELKNMAGGIVQGMSGSPIVQNGMLAGAVTHVFVGDNTRGYAIFAENMV